MFSDKKTAKCVSLWVDLADIRDSCWFVIISQTGSRSADVTYSNDGSIVVEYPSGLVVTLETGNTPTLSGDTPTALKRKIISSVDGPVHRLEWRYYIRRQTPQRTGRKLRVSSSPTPTSPSPLPDYNKKDLMVSCLTSFSDKRRWLLSLNVVIYLGLLL